MDNLLMGLQSPEGHRLAGVFKGMGVILEEHEFDGAMKICMEYPKFQCEQGVFWCCCWRMLYNEPNFVGVKSLLEIAREACGYHTIFFPNFTVN
jgi:hypothetical protein